MIRLGKLFAIAVAVLFASPSAAGPDRYSILMGSRHIGASGYEEINPGVFATWERDPLHWSIGAYRNSYGRGSIAATAFLPVVKWANGDAGLFAGAALYPIDGRTVAIHFGDIVPIGGFQARHGNAFIQIMPSDGKPVDAIVSVGFTFSAK